MYICIYFHTRVCIYKVWIHECKYMYALTQMHIYVWYTQTAFWSEFRRTHTYVCTHNGGWVWDTHTQAHIALIAFFFSAFIHIHAHDHTYAHMWVTFCDTRTYIHTHTHTHAHISWCFAQRVYALLRACMYACIHTLDVRIYIRTYVYTWQHKACTHLFAPFAAFIHFCVCVCIICMYVYVVQYVAYDLHVCICIYTLPWCAW